MALRCQSMSSTGQHGVPKKLRCVPRPPDYQQRVQQQFDSRAGGYDSSNSYHPPLAERLVRLAGLRQGEAVLDVGAGTGYVALLAARAVGPGGTVLGVDLSPAMLAKALEKASQADLQDLSFITADIDACSFAPDAFDAILCSSTLPFLPDIPASLARWRGWLRPGGRVAFNVPKGVGSQAFSVFAELAARRGLRLEDPSMPFAGEEWVRGVLHSGGYTSCTLEDSAEVNLRPGQTPVQWAAAGWAACMGMPFADLPALLPPEEVAAMKQEYLAAAAALAEGFVAVGGIAEPYTMLWVLAYR